jgi:hypothetical protein
MHLIKTPTQTKNCFILINDNVYKYKARGSNINAGNKYKSPNIHKYLEEFGSSGQIIKNNAVTFINNPYMNKGEGLTIGNAINYGAGGKPSDTIPRYDDKGVANFGRHEEEHTYQQEKWGIAFWPAYAIKGGLFEGKNPIGEDNPFEKEADDVAEIN